MEWLNNADPDKDLEKAIAKSDFRFIGLYGYALFTPGVNINCLNRDKDINPIKGTSDALLGYQHHKLIAIGNVWFNWLCDERKLAPLATFEKLCVDYSAPKLKPNIANGNMTNFIMQNNV